MKRWLLLLLLLVSAEALAVTVRGRVDVALQYGIVPMAGAHVGLCNMYGCLNYMTGPDGMYYFNAPPGQYVLVVNGVQRAQVFIPNQPYFDIAPVRAN
ncbi:hypothetical protein [Pseudoxanthomonas suwonensis]|uniref:hypothetical protein n=1 Tax=Pseudoxanthomonas suwonensis TaxID=314722 RepID=UPI00046773C8|nr:hypothetical protein [Pseudoxanthomonas suwonensis]